MLDRRFGKLLDVYLQSASGSFAQCVNFTKRLGFSIAVAFSELVAIGFALAKRKRLSIAVALGIIVAFSQRVCFNLAIGVTQSLGQCFPFAVTVGITITKRIVKSERQRVAELVTFGVTVAVSFAESISKSVAVGLSECIAQSVRVEKSERFTQSERFYFAVGFNQPVASAMRR